VFLSSVKDNQSVDEKSLGPMHGFVRTEARSSGKLRRDITTRSSPVAPAASQRMSNTPELAFLTRKLCLELALYGVRGLGDATKAGRERSGGWDVM